jgi:Spermine/spermidine synthase domain
MIRLIGISLTILIVVVSYFNQDEVYRLDNVHYGQQYALEHRDSSYSSMTWVVSDTDNFLQLRFFDKIEGGICLRPTWDDLITIGQKDPSLAHLVPLPGQKPSPIKPAKTWPYSWQPDPGTVTNSAYIRLFPLGVLLNQALMEKAGNDPAKATPKILVIGLGSGIGIAHLAHHFPLASITVVDIDQVVEDMVKDHYPLLNWMLTQKLPDGTPRLRFEVRDARQFIRIDAMREKAIRPYDMVILDAYTSGSTIPPHLMTQEFFHQCADIMDDDGIVLANIIGSYRGEKKRVSGGAMRTFRAAGMTHLWNFPVAMTGEGPGNLDLNRSRNNIIVCSKKPLDPKGNAAGWERINKFITYPQIPVGMSLSAGYIMADAGKGVFTTGLFPADVLESINPAIRAKLVAQNKAAASFIQYPLTWASEDRAVINDVLRAVDQAVAEKKVRGLPYGWNKRDNMTIVHRRETDWVLAAREMYRVSVISARDANFSGESLVGPLESERKNITTPNWIMKEAPLFTDQMPNADIFNN